MFEDLNDVHRRPAPFEIETAIDLWTDEHVSARMLALHLDGANDVASRRTESIEAAAGWIAGRFGLSGGGRVADFGCGPGLYASRLARRGARVTGIDVSARSLAHAREQAAREGLAIDYVCADYLAFASNQRFDLVCLIMYDFCALGPVRRRALLDVFATHLAPGGAVVLDVYSLPAFDARMEDASHAPGLMEGFWSPRPYFGFRNTFKYEREKVALDKFTIVEASRTRVFYNWLQYFSVESLSAELGERGFAVEEVLGDVAGAPYDSAAGEFAIVARR